MHPRCTSFVLLLLLLTTVLGRAKDKSESLQVAAEHLERILADDELVHGYFECLMERGPCTPGGKDLRSVLPDAFSTDCSACSEHQKRTVQRVLKFALEKQPGYFTEIERKYDPAGAYQARVAAAKQAGH